MASVSSVLTIGLIVLLGTQPNDFAAVPMSSDGQPAEAFAVSTAAPNFESLPTKPITANFIPTHVKALSARGAADQGLVAADGSIVPEKAPGEDTTILTVPSVVPTVPIPSVTPVVVAPGSGTLLSMPLQGQKTSRFGMRFHPIRHVWKLHSGLDLASPCGTPIGAAAAGTVVTAGWAGGNGIQVKVDHGRIAGHHVVTTYNHLSAIGVSAGQKVAVHQGVGRVGNTGFSTGCHLHFEVIADGKFTDPEPWLNGSSVVVDAAGMTADQLQAPGTTIPVTTPGDETTTPTTPVVTPPTTPGDGTTPPTTPGDGTTAPTTPADETTPPTTPAAESTAPSPKPEADPTTPAPKPEADPTTPAPKPEADPTTPTPKPDADPTTPTPKPEADPTTPTPEAEAVAPSSNSSIDQ